MFLWGAVSFSSLLKKKLLLSILSRGGRVQWQGTHQVLKLVVTVFPVSRIQTLNNIQPGTLTAKD